MRKLCIGKCDLRDLLLETEVHNWQSFRKRAYDALG